MLYTCNKFTTKAALTANIFSKTKKSKCIYYPVNRNLQFPSFPTETRLFDIHTCTPWSSKASPNNVLLFRYKQMLQN